MTESDGLRSEQATVERRRRSLGPNLLTTGVYACLFGATLIAGLPGLPHVPQARWTLAVSWALFELSCLFIHLRGTGSALYRTAAALDAAARTWGLLALIFWSGSAASPLWLFVLGGALAWTVMRRAQLAISTAVLVTGHVGLCIAFAHADDGTGSAATLVLMIVAVIDLQVTARTLRAVERLRHEHQALAAAADHESAARARERVARELHDGLGAAVMALRLCLRRAAVSAPSAGAESMHAHAGRILDELRTAVWMLRGESGEVGELQKLVVAKGESLCGGTVFNTSQPDAPTGAAVGPAVAFAVLAVFSALISGHQGDAVGLQFRLASRLELELLLGPAPATPAQRMALREAEWVAIEQGAIVQLDEAGGMLRATITAPLSETSAQVEAR